MYKTEKQNSSKRVSIAVFNYPAYCSKPSSHPSTSLHPTPHSSSTKPTALSSYISNLSQCLSKCNQLPTSLPGLHPLKHLISLSLSLNSHMILAHLTPRATRSVHPTHKIAGSQKGNQTQIEASPILSDSYCTPLGITARCVRGAESEE